MDTGETIDLRTGTVYSNAFEDLSSRIEACLLIIEQAQKKTEEQKLQDAIYLLSNMDFEKMSSDNRLNIIALLTDIRNRVIEIEYGDTGKE